MAGGAITNQVIDKRYVIRRQTTTDIESQLPPSHRLAATRSLGATERGVSSGFTDGKSRHDFCYNRLPT